MTCAAGALAAGIGFSLGLLGGGGSILVVPALTYLLGFDAKAAVVTSLAVVGLAAAAGALSAFVHKTLPLGPAMIIGTTVMIGAYAGALVGARLSDRTQLTLLGIVMMTAAAAIWSRARWPGADTSRRTARPVALGALGAGVGTVTGLVGVGGGFLIVPALVVAGGLPMREAASASLFAIALATTASLAGYATRVPLAWGFVLPFAAVASAGTITGGLVAHRVPQRRLQQVFAIALVAIAVFMFTRG